MSDTDEADVPAPEMTLRDWLAVLAELVTLGEEAEKVSDGEPLLELP